MPRLILCGKPSFARAVAIGLRVPMAGRLPYSDDEWIIAAARGHLLEGPEPEDYDPALARWTRDSLPILPEEFRWDPRGHARDQAFLPIGRERHRVEVAPGCEHLQAQTTITLDSAQYSSARIHLHVGIQTDAP